MAAGRREEGWREKATQGREKRGTAGNVRLLVILAEPACVRLSMHFVRCLPL